MPNIPTITARKLIKVLKKKGFYLDHITGSHHIYYDPACKARASVPVHKGKDLGKGITLAIIKDAGLTVEEFLKLL
ncbi:type II toxin-antitoxin system HicA family toxin [Patescibacteria group bacterium]|nr:type II toxin-antitoxin system HicA family toxin [Patescibacteria group bacterium]MBU4016138.1 type II toxin-antitoxin system HicA family toxin [Patescibacteria group bacterium]